MFEIGDVITITKGTFYERRLGRLKGTIVAKHHYDKDCYGVLFDNEDSRMYGHDLGGVIKDKSKSDNGLWLYSYEMTLVKKRKGGNYNDY